MIRWRFDFGCSQTFRDCVWR